MQDTNQRRADPFAKMIGHAKERTAKFSQMLDWAEKQGPNPEALDRLAEACGDMAATIALLGQRSQDYASDLLEGDD